MAKIEIYFPQARPILLSNFSSSPSFSDTIDSHVHSDSFRECAGGFVNRDCYPGFQIFLEFPESSDLLRSHVLTLSFYAGLLATARVNVFPSSLRSPDSRYILELSRGYVPRKCSKWSPLGRTNNASGSYVIPKMKEAAPRRKFELGNGSAPYIIVIGV